MRLNALLLLMLFTAWPARADVMVLVHGYLGSPASWEASGVAPLLERGGWRRTAVLGPGLPDPQPAGHDRSLYLAALPSEAPILVQAAMLREVFARIQRLHPVEPVVVVGHSAGGVVARAALVGGAEPNIRALVTIASPHLGTELAEAALDATSPPFPLSIPADFFGGPVYHTARRSRALLLDLVRPRPGTLLGWLNLQPHPEIRYVSVVRGAAFPLAGDGVVPSYSQDMGNVPALRGRSESIVVPAGHGLTPGDANVLLDLLSS